MATLASSVDPVVEVLVTESVPAKGAPSAAPPSGVPVTKEKCIECGSEIKEADLVADPLPFYMLDESEDTKEHLYVLCAFSCNKVTPVMVCISPYAEDIEAYIKGLGLAEQLEQVKGADDEDDSDPDSTTVLGNVPFETFLKATGQTGHWVGCKCKGRFMIFHTRKGDMVPVLKAMQEYNR
ncbi:Hypothetical protein POVN_LOCUS673 [uncultured virus]|nr:Hypothetical protein POVN_LOCUS673 [uncultured virus]